MIPDGLAKPRPKLLETRERHAERNEIDRQERAKCKARSGGRCEVIEQFFGYPSSVGVVQYERRCSRRTSQNHHLKGGIGRRNIGASILAEHRIEVCSICHKEITGHVLQPVGPGREDAATVRYERQR